MKLLKMILILTGVVYHVKNNKKMFNKLLAERAFEFDNIKYLIDQNRLIYKFKDEKRSKRL